MAAPKPIFPKVMTPEQNRKFIEEMARQEAMDAAKGESYPALEPGTPDTELDSSMDPNLDLPVLNHPKFDPSIITDPRMTAPAIDDNIMTLMQMAGEQPPTPPEPNREPAALIPPPAADTDMITSESLPEMPELPQAQRIASMGGKGVFLAPTAQTNAKNVSEFTEKGKELDVMGKLRANRALLEGMTITDPITLKVLEEIPGIPQLKNLDNTSKVLREMIGKRAEMPEGGAQVDYTPLMGFLDYLGGTQQAKYYKPPKDQESAMMKLYEMANKSDKDYLSALGALTKEGWDETVRKTLATQGLEQGLKPVAIGGGAGKDKGVEEQYQKFLKYMTTQKSWKDTVDKVDTADGLRAKLDINSSSSVNMVFRELLRVAGDTRPSDADVRAFSGNPNLVNIFNRIFQQKFGDIGYLTALDKDELGEVVDVMHKSAIKKLLQKATGATKVANIAFKGVEEKQAMKLLGGSFGIDPAQMEKAYEELEKKSVAKKEKAKVKTADQIADEEVAKMMGGK